jgi:acetoacetyl-CoA synthetase
MTPDDSFFDLGGDSLRAVELLQLIANQLHREVVPSVLLTAPTPRQLAATMATPTGSGGSMSTAPLLMRSGSGSGKPVFLLPGAGGDVFILRTVSGLLRLDRAVYGLRASGLDPRQPLHRTVEEMADYFLAQIQAIQPTGPYSLVGLSFGGLVGYEIAARLQRAGERVHPLVLIDTHVIPLERWRHRRWWLAWRTTSLIDLLRDPRGQVPRVLLRFASRRVSWITVPSTLQRSPAPIARVKARGDRPAYLAYRPLPIPQEIVFIRAAKRRAVYGEPLRDWRRLTGGSVTVVPVPGDHVSMLREPHASALAARLSEHLRN